MNKGNLLFKLLKGTIVALIVCKILQILFRIYAIITVTRVINGNESIRTQFSYILDELEIENFTDNVIIISYLILLSSWFYKKYRNAHTVSHFPLSYKPIWALFSFIIPFFKNNSYVTQKNFISNRFHCAVPYKTFSATKPVVRQ